jgi:hypothetical protein
VVTLSARLNWLCCAVLIACAQVQAHAQLFLVAGRSATNSPDPGLVALVWNPSPDPRATGYFLCWGLDSSACTNFLDAGNVTDVTVAGMVPNVGYYFTIVTYDAAGDRSPPSNQITATVPPANPVVTTWPVASAITYGQTLAASSLSGGSATPAGTFAFTTPSTAPNAGTALQSVTYTPTDTTNYNPASGTVSLTVNKAAPSVTAWPVANAITYGQTLAASTLSGGSATPAGTFAFTTPSTAPNTGTALQTVTYTPSDATNYNTASGTVSVTVNKAAPSVTAWPLAIAITYGQTLAASTLSGGSATPAGTFAFTAPSTAPNAGTALQSVTYTPTDTTNYNSASSTVSVTVNKTSPSVTTWPVASAITYRQTLAASTLSGGSATPAGTFAFTTLSTAPNAGTALQSVTYMPTDSTNYNTVSSTASVTVKPKAVTVTGLTANDKVYDGNTAATLNTSGAALVGLVSPDVVTLNTADATGAFNDPNVGTAKTVMVSGLSLSGTDAGNCTLASSVASATADILARAITVTAVADSKMYDGTPASAGVPAITAGSLASTDSAVWTQTFYSKTVGTGKTLTPGGAVAVGNGGYNYTVTFLNNTNGVITAKGLTAAGITASNKAYDDNTTATLNTTGATLVGKVPGDAVTLNTAGATGAFTNPDVGTAKSVLVSGLSLSGTDAGDYTVAQPTTTANITQASSATALVSSANPSLQGPNVTFTATVTSVAATSTTLTGNVQLYTNGVALGSPVALTDGVASLSTADLPPGTNTILAAYLGDSNFLSSSNSRAQLVAAVAGTPSTIGI